MRLRRGAAARAWQDRTEVEQKLFPGIMQACGLSSRFIRTPAAGLAFAAAMGEQRRWSIPAATEPAMSTPSVLAVILAGGLARRMGGGDKPLVRLAGRPLIAHVLERLAPQVSALVVNANGAPGRFAAFGLPVVPDGVPDHPGPLAGVLAGLEWAVAHRPDVGAVLSVPGDAPFLPADLVSRLAAAGAPAFAASAGQSHPTVALWPVALAPALRAALVEEGLRKVGAFAARHGAIRVEWPVGPVDPFFNANTPDDLATAARLASRLPAP